MYTTASDDALLSSFAAGDEGAGLAFIRRHQTRVYGLAKHIAGPALAEDIAQEAFLRAWKHAGAYDPRKASVTTWLLTITRNLAIDALRVRRPDVIDPDAIIDLTDDSFIYRNSLPTVEQSNDQMYLADALRRIPTDQRRAVVLATLGGKTAQEICEMEDIPLGTAKTRIRIGLRALNRMFSSEPEEIR